MKGFEKFPRKDLFRLAPSFEGGPLAGQVDPFAAGLEEVGVERTVYAFRDVVLERPAVYVLEDRGTEGRGGGLVWRLLRELDVELGLVPPPPPRPVPPPPPKASRPVPPPPPRNPRPPPPPRPA